MHCQSMNKREWVLGNGSVDELLYEYKNLGVVKNYIGSFSSNADEKISIRLVKNRAS